MRNAPISLLFALVLLSGAGAAAQSVDSTNSRPSWRFGTMLSFGALCYPQQDLLSYTDDPPFMLAFYNEPYLKTGVKSEGGLRSLVMLGGIAQFDGAEQIGMEVGFQDYSGQADEGHPDFPPKFSVNAILGRLSYSNVVEADRDYPSDIVFQFRYGAFLFYRKMDLTYVSHPPGGFYGNTEEINIDSNGTLVCLGPLVSIGFGSARTSFGLFADLNLVTSASGTWTRKQTTTRDFNEVSTSTNSGDYSEMVAIDRLGGQQLLVNDIGIQVRLIIGK